MAAAIMLSNHKIAYFYNIVTVKRGQLTLLF